MKVVEETYRASFSLMGKFVESLQCDKSAQQTFRIFQQSKNNSKLNQNAQHVVKSKGCGAEGSNWSLSEGAQESRST